MIKADKECIKINGDLIDVATDFICVTRSVREMFSCNFGDDVANAALDAFYEVSKLTESKFEKMTKEEIDKTVESVLRGR